MAGLILACLCSASGGVWADVYKYRDYEGRVYLTDTPMKGGRYKLVKRYRMQTTPRRSASSGDSLAAMQARRQRYAPMIESAARASQVRPELVHAVVRAESAYRPDAVSEKGARGLMQLMPATAERFGVTDPHDPRQNLRGGTRYLHELLKLFNNDLRLAVAAYNAGENAVISYGRRVPPYPETRRYVEKVLGFYEGSLAGNKLAQR
jgi:soluble lytic murein transglycosylase-like protein